MQTGPASRLREQDGQHVIVVADGDVPTRTDLDVAWPGWDGDAAFVIAADGGWVRAQSLGLNPAVLLGDLDSLDAGTVAAVRASGIPILRSSVDKDESDTELALLEAVRRGATRVTVVGALGGPRLDHALANVWLLAHPGLGRVEVSLLDARTRVSLVTAPDPGGRPVTRLLPGPIEALVSLFPLGGDAEGISTSGLRYPLVNEPLRIGPARGLSNVRSASAAAVTVGRGRLLVVEAALGDSETVVAPAPLSSRP